MIREWLNYLWVFALNMFSNNSPRQIMGISEASEEEELSSEHKFIGQDFDDSNSTEMALMKADAGVREEEMEQTTETSLSEVTKETANSQMMEKAATFHGQQTSKVVEETGFSTQNVECEAKVSQAVSQSVSENRSVTTTKSSKSSSYSFEETGEYEYEVTD